MLKRFSKVFSVVLRSDTEICWQSRITRTYPKNMGVAEIEQFCGLARKAKQIAL